MQDAFNILAGTFVGVMHGGYWLTMRHVRIALACRASVLDVIAVAQQGVS